MCALGGEYHGHALLHHGPQRPIIILVIGGTGFIGAPLARRLVQDGHKVVKDTALREFWGFD